MGTAPTRPSVLVGQLLRRERNRHGLTLRQVSSRMAERGEPFPASTLARVEQGKLDPGVRRLQNLLALYDVSPALVAELVEIERLRVDLPEETDLAALRDQGLNYWKQGDVGRGLAYTIAALNYEADSDDRALRHDILLQFAIIARRLGQLNLARHVLDSLACDEPDPALVPNILIAQCSIWLNLGAIPVATALIQHARALVPDDSDSLRVKAMAIHQHAKVLEAVGDFEAVLELIDESREIYERIEDLHDLTRCRIFRGTVLRALGQNEEAVALFRETLQLAESRSDLAAAVACRNEIGRLLCEMGRPEEGLAELREALGQAVLNGIRAGEFNAHYHLWKAYEQLGDTEQARIERENAVYYVRFATCNKAEIDEVRQIARDEAMRKRS